MPDYDQIAYEPLGRVARVTMNRPRYRNAQSRTLLRELDDAFARATDDEEIRVIVLAAEGKDFSAGHDLGTPEFVDEENEHPRQGRSDVERSFGYSWQQFLDMSLRWRDIPKPTIAQVHGWCIFGGWIIASAMDLVVAADDARFLTNLVQYFTLPWDVGARKAKEILFDNREIGAAEAKDLGFVNHVWPRDELEEQTLELANRIAANATFLLRQFKLSVNQMQDAAGFRAAVQAAHANYQLTEAHNKLREQERIAKGGEQRSTRRLEAVERLIGSTEEENDGAQDR
jgi:enoyl-CoA hydratase